MALSLQCRSRQCAFLFALAIPFMPDLLARSGSSAGEATTFPPIRVESREVVVPVVVLDRRHFRTEGTVLFEEDQEITDLRQGDFRILEDGIEQSVRNVSLELPRVRHVRDNVAQHVEDSFTPRGSWSSPDLTPLWPAMLSPLPVYLVSYVPPLSPPGSCHQIKVHVGRKHATVYARESYCNTHQPLTDPLGGTELGERMQTFANSEQLSAFAVAAQATPLLGADDANRVEVAVDFPWDAVKRVWHRVNLYATVSVLGVVYDKDRNVVARFSDTASTTQWNYYRGPLPPDKNLLKQWERAGVPNHYRTQVDLAPGEYSLQVVVSDGEKFGRTEIPLKVDGVQHAKLGVSGLALCKRFQEVGEGAQAANRAPQYVPLVSQGIEFVPAGEKRFAKNERLLGYFEIYNSQFNPSAGRSLRVQLRITDPSTGQVKMDAGSRTISSATPGESTAIPLAAELAIGQLAPGNYRVNVQVSDEDGRSSGWRGTCFTIDN